MPYYIAFITLYGNEVPGDILWNGEPMTMRGYEKRDDLKNNGADDPNMYYTAFPTEFRRYFPMFGTKSRNTGDSNTLKITKPFVLYMIRSAAWPAVDVSTWHKINGATVPGSLFGPLKPSDVEIYEKFFNTGTHTDLDTSAAYYLLREGNTT